jgi:PTH1 family peptidyl-tRNA hydrolase
VETLLVAGLGNPGDEYAATRHNVGFMVADELCRRGGGRWESRKGLSAIARVRIGGAEIVLCKPLTYMNNSGMAVAETLRRFDLEVSSLLVVVDDLALPLGRLRIRTRGSDGGHNGLTSVIFALGSDEFARLRCGIGQEAPPPKGTMPDFVLSPFDRPEVPALREMVARAADAAATGAVGGIAAAMNRFNT